MLKRLAFFAYGVISYLVGLVALLYAVGFVGNFLVPRRLDGPATGSWPQALACDLGLLALFALQHSVMARPGFKRWWTRIVAREIERSTYVLFSGLALLLLIGGWRPLGGSVWSVDNAAGRAVLYALFALGWVLVLVSTFLIDHFDLFGLRQVWLALRGKPYTPVAFATPALYRLVRHPLYLGLLLGFWSTPAMSLSHLLFAVSTTVYILAAIRLEEADLLRAHGREYGDYRRRVPMLWPFGGRTGRRALREDAREGGRAAQQR